MNVRLRTITLSLVTLLMSLPVATLSQTVRVDSQQPQLLLAASSAVTLQQELDKAGALGFHTVLGTTRGNAEMILLMERNVKAADKFQIRLVATNTTATFQKETSEAALQGYRAVPQTFLNKPAGIVGNEIAVVMERPVNPAKRYEYKLLATNQTSTLESEWVVAISQGYKAIGLITRAETMLLVERETK